MGAKMSSAAKRGGAAVVAALLAALLLKIVSRSHPKVATLEAGPKNSVKLQTRRKLELGKLQAELTPLKVSALKRRALAAGVGQEALEEVDDADNPKEAIVSIIVDAHRKAFESEAQGGAVDEAGLEALRAELTPLKLSVLKKRARAAGVSEGVLEDSVDDADDPKEAIVSLLLDARRKDLVAAGDGHTAIGVLDFGTEIENMRAELAPMKMSILKKRALAARVDEEVIEEVVDADNPKDKLV